MIYREDMLELTRRLTATRSNLVRLAGAYIDEEGYIEGTFHTHFLKLSGEERQRCLDIAKTVLFSRTNEELKDYQVPVMKAGSIWQLLYVLRDCELKNDALLLNLYEMIADQYPKGSPYAIYVYYGVYDIPKKAMDRERLDESEEVYQYLIVAIGRTDCDLTVSMPETGFLYPAFSERSTDLSHVNVYEKEGFQGLLTNHILGVR